MLMHIEYEYDLDVFKNYETEKTNGTLKNLLECKIPQNLGGGLNANRSGQWRYRVGNYRILADITRYKTYFNTY